MNVHAVVLLFAACSQAAPVEPCCQECVPGKKKYYSIPNPEEANPQCGECCLNPSRYSFWKVFEPKLLQGDCATQGFTKYVGTEKDGVWPLQVANDRYVRSKTSAEKMQTFCPSRLQAVFADMHDGDKKEVTIAGKSMVIRPSGNNQTWVVHTELDLQSCSARVDFNVPGKPGPPPVNLTATLWFSAPATGSVTAKKAEFEFTDPSGTLDAKGYPLNHWVDLSTDGQKRSDACPDSLEFLYADMHDGDSKMITISGTSMTIKPYGNKQTWIIKSKVDTKSCSATIDFNVPGKPSPPPVNLTATLLGAVTGGGTTEQKKSEFEFTDPTGTLAGKDFPLNRWVQIAKKDEHDEISV